jgi:hypothetical protein
MTTNHRRHQSRHVTCVPTGVESQDTERVALIRDASATGALLLSRSQFPMHEQLKLSIQLEGSKKTADVDAKVVRVERLKDGFWSWGIGVAFTPARTDLESTFKALSDRQEQLYGKP